MKESLKRNRCLFLSIILSVNILLSGCYSVKKSTVLSSKRIPNSKKPTGNSYYSVEVLEKSTPNDPVYQVSVIKNDRYAYKTKNYIEEKVKPSLLNWTGSSLALVGSIPLSIEVAKYNIDDGWLLASSLLLPVGLIWTVANIANSTNFKHDRPGNYRNRYRQGPLEYRYESSPLKSSEIRITDNLSTTRKFQANEYGQLSFSPLNDFNLNFSKNNDEISFSFFHKGRKFDNVLHLHPSSWLHRYVKVKNPEANILVANSGNQKIGTARKGLVYKVITWQDRYKVELLQDKFGWLDFHDVDTYLSADKRSDVKTAIKNHAEEETNKWQKQGEFELPDIYRQRIQARKETANDFFNEGMQIYQQDYIDIISWNDATISDYDPNNRTFKIKIPELEEFIINVSIGVARKFKENWEIRKFRNQNFTLVNGEWELASLDIEMPFGYTAHYSNDLLLTYDPLTQIGIDLESIELPEIDKDLDPIRYEIGINLPKARSVYEDAVAIVIGNTNYKYAQNVDYALNDAQMMKTYLEHLGGFSKIFFVPDATKADFERYFGTRDNPRGELYRRVKERERDVFVFYSGHGAPGLSDQNSYFVPVDCHPNTIELSGYQADILYHNLSQIQARSVTVILDACFSGIGITDQVSSIVPKVKEPFFRIQNGTLITAAASDEYAFWLKQQRHGLFTYFFLKAIHDYKNADLNSDNNGLSFKEIFEYISSNSIGVPYYAGILHGGEQHPDIQGNGERIFVEF